MRWSFGMCKETVWQRYNEGLKIDFHYEASCTRIKSMTSLNQSYVFAINVTERQFLLKMQLLFHHENVHDLIL